MKQQLKRGKQMTFNINNINSDLNTLGDLTYAIPLNIENYEGKTLGEYTADAEKAYLDGFGFDNTLEALSYFLELNEFSKRISEAKISISGLDNLRLTYLDFACEIFTIGDELDTEPMVRELIKEISGN